MEYQRPIYDISIDEALHLGVDEVAFVHDPAIQELWVAMASEITKLFLSEDKMIVTGPALVPNKLIYRVHPKTGAEYYIRFSEETIEAIVQRYFTQNKQIHFNLEHNKENDVQGVILESWIVEDPSMDKSVAMGFKDLKKGSWMISVKVADHEFWNDYVKTGKVRGFSIEGAFAQSLAEAMAEGLPHYTADGELWTGPTHKDADGRLMTGAVHTDESEYLYHKDELVIDPNAGETQDEYVSRCIAYEVGNGYEVDQATAMCYLKWDERVKLDLKQYTLTPEEAELLIKEILMAKESYRDYPQEASDAAKRALKYKQENPGNTCGTRVGWARANQLASRRPISEETIARMASFQRHQQNKDVPYEEGCGGLMWDAWGGTSGIEWAQRKLRQIRRESGR
jgi:hypothetical protein